MAASWASPDSCLAELVAACLGSSKEAEPQLCLRLAMQAMVLVLSRMATEQLLPQLAAAMREVCHAEPDLVCTTSDARLLPSPSCFPSFLQPCGRHCMQSMSCFAQQLMLSCNISKRLPTELCLELRQLSHHFPMLAVRYSLSRDGLLG